MEKWIYFDMDGTIADLYGIEGWEDRLNAEDAEPYAEAQPLVSCAALARALHRVQRAGYKIGIITWTALRSSAPYHKAVGRAKVKWLFKHLPSVTWDAIHILEYGTPKQLFEKNSAVLFDDNEKIRKNWTGIAFDQTKILENLKWLARV